MFTNLVTNVVSRVIVSRVIAAESRTAVLRTVTFVALALVVLSVTAAPGFCGDGKAKPSDFNFMHLYDKASPVLSRNLLSPVADFIHFVYKLVAVKTG
jgi:hypothetical protein